MFCYINKQAIQHIMQLGTCNTEDI